MILNHILDSALSEHTEKYVGQYIQTVQWFD